MRVAVLVLAMFVLPAAAYAEDKTFLPRAVIAAGLKQADCDVPLEEVTELDPDDLGDGLKLVQVSCWRAAYNFGSILFAVDPNARDQARLLQFDIVDEKGKLAKTYSIDLPDFDAKKKTLASYHKSRGVGDCGTIGEWRWTGRDFKLTGFWDKEKCDGELFDADAREAKWRVYPLRK